MKGLRFIPKKDYVLVRNLHKKKDMKVLTGIKDLSNGLWYSTIEIIAYNEKEDNKPFPIGTKVVLSTFSSVLAVSLITDEENTRVVQEIIHISDIVGEDLQTEDNKKFNLKLSTM